MDVRGRVVLITGASQGIGRATALRLAREGAKLALVARSTEALEAVAEGVRAAGGEALVISADLRSPGQPERVVGETVRHFGGVEVLINNAGQAAAGEVGAVKLEHFRQITELNVYAPLLLMQAVIPLMRERGGGLIVNVSSMVSKMKLPGLAAYAATKTALNMLSDTARVELAEDGIRVITVFPRMTATDFARHSLGDHERRRQQRGGTPPPVDSAEDVAERILAALVEEPDEQFMV